MARARRLGPLETERRADGWPLCPQCGEDELYSLLDTVQWREGKPTIEEYEDAGLRCYRCGWSRL